MLPVGLTHNDITAMLIDSVDSIEALVAYIGEDERRVRRAAISLLANCAALSKTPLSAQSAGACLDLLTHTDWGVRCCALEALALHPASALTPHDRRFVSLLDHKDWGVRHIGVEAIELLEVESGLLPICYDLLMRLPSLSWELRRRLCARLCQLPEGALSAVNAEAVSALPDGMETALAQQLTRPVSPLSPLPPPPPPASSLIAWLCNLSGARVSDTGTSDGVPTDAKHRRSSIDGSGGRYATHSTASESRSDGSAASTAASTAARTAAASSLGGKLVAAETVEASVNASTRPSPVISRRAVGNGGVASSGPTLRHSEPNLVSVLMGESQPTMRRAGSAGSFREPNGAQHGAYLESPPIQIPPRLAVPNGDGAHDSRGLTAHQLGGSWS
jgi:hypothetical protein